MIYSKRSKLLINIGKSKERTKKKQQNIGSRINQISLNYYHSSINIAQPAAHKIQRQEG